MTISRRKRTRYGPRRDTTLDHFGSGLIALLAGILVAGVGLAHDYEAVMILGLLIFSVGFFYWNYVLWKKLAKRLGVRGAHHPQLDGL